MFKRIQLRNFRSFRELDFDMCWKRDSPQRFVSVYGENGSGKTNLVESIALLVTSIGTLVPVHPFSLLPRFRRGGVTIDNAIGHSVRRGIREDTLHLISEYVSEIRTIGSEDDTVVRYTFEVGGRDAEYEMAFGPDCRLVRESLRYVLEKRTVQYFSVSSSEKGIDISINNSVFGNPLVSSLTEEARMLWGNHTLLAILLDQYRLNNPSFMEDNVGPGMKAVIDYIARIGVHVSSPLSDTTFGLHEGTIPSSQADWLDGMEEALDGFFTRICSDVSKVHYRRSESIGRIDYELCFDRIIGGKVCEIPYGSESRGTRKLVQLFPQFMAAAYGYVSFVDEMDSNIHDLLVTKLINGMMPDISGQLVVTTHNTSLLEDADPRSVYILQVDAEGGRSISSMASIERIQKTHNKRKRYLDGAVGGVPYIGEIYMSEIAKTYYEGMDAS